ncbi:hypothetical protein [Pseudactinotalea sp. HY158]|uniref:hypothetical protein n=1 Tax=Pseudactinotalea sp. HY158 TaxID=2654547 RepID=UPI00129CA4CE|nr:hypothetical protein [Pseudactinotalea sp. HY158]QGH68595.1 hypothetical protein GCE65_03050 [Pseudactinotalea sp. HY158]
MDVEACTERNAPRWRERADEVCERSTAHSDFRDVARTSLIGTNVDARKLLHFRGLEPPTIVSTFDVRAAEVGETQAERLTYGNSWGERRAAFERGIGVYTRAVYGTLDIPDCPGDDRYGPFRLSYPALDGDEPIVVPHNSAAEYGHGGRFHAARLSEDVAGWDSRADVAVARLAARIPSSPRPRWPMLLSEGDENHDLVELVCPAGQRPMSDVAEIRVGRRYKDDVLRSALRGLGSEDATDIEDSALLLAELRHEQESGRLRLTILEEVT